MNFSKIILSSLAAACLLVTPSFAEEDIDSAFQGLKHTKGPVKANIGARAVVDLKTDDCIWLDKASTAIFMKQMGNFSSPGELGCIVGQYGFAVFEYDDIGYVKDDEKDSLDAGEILSSIKEGTKEANARRAKMGIAPLNIVGWYKKPYYNPDTNYLEWIIEAESEGERIVNVNTRILGRHGLMEVTLVTDVESIEPALKEYKAWLDGFSYKSGESYAEYRSGDKIAEYGLTALMTGASVFVLFKYWKPIVAGIVALGMAIKRFFTGKKSSKGEMS